MVVMDRLESAVAAELFKIGAVKDKSRSPGGMGFRLALHEKQPDAPLSPVYLDLRLIRSFPGLMDKVVALYWRKLVPLKAQLIADVPTAATPIVSVLSFMSGVPMITPREPKTHGSGARIDGVYAPGQRVVLIDDLITKADSKFPPIRALETAGLKVSDVIVLVDREQGGRDQLESAGYGLHAVFTLRGLMESYVSDGLISAAIHREILDYLGASR